MTNRTTDHPGIYIPPPLLYAGIFLLALFMQKEAAIDSHFFRLRVAHMTGIFFFLLAAFFIFRSLGQFIRTKNTVMTIKPAASLQTTGIYRMTRNPMYQGLLFVYLGLTCWIGNWWNLILLPLLILMIQQYVIKREEKYLTRTFGSAYTEYRQQVRRWL
jgi:protein-S-isoprenylcysteine O-methyltransferase Ste14